MPNSGIGLKSTVLLVPAFPINRVFSAIDPSEFSDCFFRWINRLRVECGQKVEAIDDKRIRNSQHQTSQTIHMVSAFAPQSGLCLGQGPHKRKQRDYGYSTTAFFVEYHSIVTIDAMGCQKAIASKILKQEADYVLAVKGNQQLLEEGILDTIRFNEPVCSDVDADCGHGRIKTRKCFVYNNLEMIQGADQ